MNMSSPKAEVMSSNLIGFTNYFNELGGSDWTLHVGVSAGQC